MRSSTSISWTAPIIARRSPRIRRARPASSWPGRSAAVMTEPAVIEEIGDASDSIAAGADASFIPLSDPDITAAELEAVDAVLRSPRLSSGPTVEAFEAAFAAYLGRKYAVAVPSGTLGLLITLACLRDRPRARGDRLALFVSRDGACHQPRPARGRSLPTSIIGPERLFRRRSKPASRERRAPSSRATTTDTRRHGLSCARWRRGMGSSFSKIQPRRSARNTRARSSERSATSPSSTFPSLRR